MRKRRKSMRDIDKFEARLFIEAGMPVRDCAQYMDVSLPTLMRALAELRVKFGPERHHPRRRHLARPRIKRVENSGESVIPTSNT